jgi:DNA-binding MarR family transcriptional regulator
VGHILKPYKEIVNGAIVAPFRIEENTLMASQIDLDLADLFVNLYPRFQRWVERLIPSGEPTATRVRMLYAVHCNGPLQMGNLADALGVTARRVTALVDALEAEGLVAREPHPGDRRVTRIAITKSGASVVNRTYDAHRRAVAALFDELPADEKEALLGTMRRVGDRLRRSDVALEETQRGSDEGV